MTSQILSKVSNSTYPSAISSYKKIRIIGRGSYGYLYESVVLEGIHKDEHIAIKEICINFLDEKQLLSLQVSKKYYIILLFK